MANQVTIVKISKLRTLIRNTSFNSSGNFVPYQFIAVAIDKNGKPYFYANTQPSSNSWTNYPGQKIWHNDNEPRWKKDDVLREAEYNLSDALDYLKMDGEIKFYKIVD